MLDIDSLMSSWQSRTLLQLLENDSIGEALPVNDSIYADRLDRMPSIIEMTYNDITKQFIERYATKHRRLMSNMLGLSTYYLPMIESALDSYNMPQELKYLPIIESAFNPKAVSRVGAKGLWQFMFPTGKFYGLKANSYIDERFDPLKSTHAAIRYLRDLYKFFQSWDLVIAAYNCGPGNVKKAIIRSGGKTNFWQIYRFLPRETRGYVPAFIAANYIMTYYCHHNICPMNTEIIPPTDTLQISRELHLQQVADLCDITIDELKSLNPQYKRNIIPGNTKPYTLRLPQTKIATFIDNQDTIYNHRAAELFKNRKTVAVSNKITPTVGKGTLSYHTIRSGETLSTIAQRYGVKVSQLKDWNGLSSNRIRAGKKLKIYK